MKKVEGLAKSVRSILKDQRYYIDFYQREYRWQTKQVQELFEDLSERFLEDYDEDHQRDEVESYGHYFLGSVIFSSRENRLYIVDGQQRLTSLTLLLMLLDKRQGEREDRVKLADLIFSEKYGQRSFNISVQEREHVMEALFAGKVPDLTNATESVETIALRYQDLGEILDASELSERALPFFCDWLIDNVHLVEITAANDEDAYTIFETMNDRGLSQTPLDMLKGYLLANIKNEKRRTIAAETWRKRVEALRRVGKDEESDAVKAWLRGRHSESIRSRGRAAENRDFEQIGTEFHRWVGNHAQELGLNENDGSFDFIHSQMYFYTSQFERLRLAAEAPVDGLEPVFHVAAFNFSLLYPLLLAPLTPDDSITEIDQKIRTVATFLDILLARRAVNYLSMTVAAMNYAIFLIIKEIRNKNVTELATILSTKLEEQGCDFHGTSDGERAGIERFGLNQWSKRYIKVLLARMTQYIEQQSDIESSLAAYLAPGKFEIEHIWADHADQHLEEFPGSADFADYRNRFGGLLLLPKKFNASYGDLPYQDKLPHYLTQNLLARSLHPQCYERNPGFRQFLDRSGLPFQAHLAFQKEDLQMRQELYGKLAEQVWDPKHLFREIESNNGSQKI